MSAFKEGQEAFAAGKLLSDNPHVCGITKLGNVKLDEEGIEWERGYFAAKPMRIASKEEWAAAMKGNPFSQRKFKRRVWK